MPGVDPSRVEDQGTPGRRVVMAAAGGVVLGVAACGGPDVRRRPSPGSSAPSPGLSAPSSGPTALQASVPSVARTGGPDIVHGPRGRAEVALTFHGQGGDGVCRRVLEACAAGGAAVTVFAVGTWVHDDPSLVRAFAAAGHEIGNHTWSHRPMRQLSASAARTEVARGRAALVGAGLVPSWCFRPSGTPRSTATIRAAALVSGYHRCVSYDVDPADYLDPGAAAVRSRTREAVQAGSIVSLHLGHPGTAEALPGILADLTRSRLSPVTLSTLLRD